MLTEAAESPAAHESKNGVQSQTPGNSVQPSQPPSPPAMYIDPSLRLPAPPPPPQQQQKPPPPQQPQHQQHQQQNMSAPPPQQTVPTQVQVQAQQAQQAMAAGRSDAIGLLIEASAFESHGGPHPPGPVGAPPGAPYAAGPEYYGPPTMGASDGYEDQLETMYINGPVGAVPAWMNVNVNAQAGMQYYYPGS